mgnify:CR=1 FL=1
MPHLVYIYVYVYVYGIYLFGLIIPTQTRHPSISTEFYQIHAVVAVVVMVVHLLFIMHEIRLYCHLLFRYHDIIDIKYRTTNNKCTYAIA